jgi:hypothetical protein
MRQSIFLQFVHVWRDGDMFQVESTDGHRAFRYRFPAWDSQAMPTLWRFPDAGLLLHAKPLKKAVANAKLLTVTDDMRAVFHGGKKQALDELSSVNLAGHYSVHCQADCAKVGTYPDLNQLWPETTPCTMGDAWAFNSRYLKDWCTVVEKLSPSGVMSWRGGQKPTTPFISRCDYQGRIGQHCSDAELELLLMPVMLRKAWR